MSEGRARLRARQFFGPSDRSADGWNEVSTYARDWERAYRNRWQHDRVVRSTHGVNCTGSCSWKIHVKDGLVTWETQETDYPTNGRDTPDYEPRGCPRGASFSWYIYSPLRPKHPYVRGVLLEMFREAKAGGADPVEAWESIVSDPDRARAYKSQRGKGGFLRATWKEAAELIAAAHVHTTRRYGPDRIAGFTPIPAMSMVSHAAGSRFLSLIGGVCLSFYDWYADLPPASPQVWGDQTDVPESADWWNAGYLILWGSNIPQTRTPDAHFLTEARYRGQKVVVVSPDYAGHTKFADHWLPAVAGTDGALAMAMGHVILKEFYVERETSYFRDYARRYTDMPMLVSLEQRPDGTWGAGRFLRASDLGEDGENAEWKTVVWDAGRGEAVVPSGSIGFRWGEEGAGRWNLDLGQVDPALTLHGIGDEAVEVTLPRFDGGETEGGTTMRPRRPREARRRPPRDDRPRPRLRPVRRRPRRPARRVAERLRRRLDSLHAGLAGGDHRRRRRHLHPGRARVRRQRRADRGPLDDRHGCRHQPLVPLRRDLPDDALAASSSAAVRASTAAAGPTTSARRRCGRSPAGRRSRSRSTGRGRRASSRRRRSGTWRPTSGATSPTAPRSSPRRPATVRSASATPPTATRSPPGSAGCPPIRPSTATRSTSPTRPRRREPRSPTTSSPSCSPGGCGSPARTPTTPANFPRVLSLWRANLLGSSSKGHEYFLRHLLGVPDAAVRSRRVGARASSGGGRVAGGGADRQDRPVHDDRLPDERLLPLLRRRPAGRHLVREARHLEHRPAPVRAPVQRGDPAAVGGAQRLGRLRDDRRPSSAASPAKHLGTRTDIVAGFAAARHAGRARPAVRRGPRLEGRRVRAGSRQDDAEPGRRRARLHGGRREDARARPARRGGRDRRQGRLLEAGAGGRRARAAATAARTAADRPTDARRCARGIDVGEAILALSGTTNGRLAVERLPGARAADRPRARPRARGSRRRPAHIR